MQLDVNTNIKRTFIWVVALVIAYFFINALSTVLTPFIVAAVLAYVLHPIVKIVSHYGDKSVKQKISMMVWVALVELFFLFLLTALVMLLVPVVTKEIPSLLTKLPELLDYLNVWISERLGALVTGSVFDASSLRQYAEEYFNSQREDLLTRALGSVRSNTGLFLTVVSNALLIPVILFYLLLVWERLLKQAKDLMPLRYRKTWLGFFAETDTVLGQYLRGQILVMLILAVFYSTGLWLFGLDLALSIGVFTGLAVFIPYIGFGLGLILATTAGLLQFEVSYVVIMLAVVYGIGQALESFVLTPYMVGKRVGLPPLTVIFLLMAFGQLLGFVGLLLALPLSAVLAVAIRHFTKSYKNSDFYLK
jgi:predicted PurR-regulated permease PerM